MNFPEIFLVKKVLLDDESQKLFVKSRFELFYNLNTEFSEIQEGDPTGQKILLMQGFQLLNNAKITTFVLPGCSFFEKSLDVFNVFGRHIKVHRIFRPVGLSRNDSTILRNVSSIMLAILSANGPVVGSGLPVQAKRTLPDQFNPPKRLNKVDLSAFNKQSLVFNTTLGVPITNFFSGDSVLDASKSISILKKFSKDKQVI